MTDPREYYTDPQDRSDIDDEFFERDLLTSALAGIRRRHDSLSLPFGRWPRSIELSQADVPRLLAAVDAVLGLHQPHDVLVTHCCSAHSAGMLTGTSATLAQHRDETTVCPDCFRETVTECRHCDCRGGEWPCEDVLAISRALLGDNDG